jgi:anti-sigma regulatory factor (Ser/Thr protein kinase)
MSEIAANAVRFSLPPVRDRPAVYAALHHDPERGELTLYVWDNGPAYPEPAPPAADPAASENGRGLLITDALSREWGYWATPASGGKVTYAVLGIPAPGAPPQPG